jgi:hypothetical protein
MDDRTQARLESILQRESRSVMVYTAEAFPWTSALTSEAVKRLLTCIHQEQEALTQLGRFLVRQRVPLPYLGSFPVGFTTINFLALDYLLPRLSAFEKTSIAELEGDLAALQDPLARPPVEKLLAVKKRNLEMLEALIHDQSVSKAS